jgi:hypothetical protein
MRGPTTHPCDIRSAGPRSTTTRTFPWRTGSTGTARPGWTRSPPSRRRGGSPILARWRTSPVRCGTRGGKALCGPSALARPGRDGGPPHRGRHLRCRRLLGERGQPPVHSGQPPVSRWACRGRSAATRRSSTPPAAGWTPHRTTSGATRTGRRRASRPPPTRGWTGSPPCSGPRAPASPTAPAGRTRSGRVLAPAGSDADRQLPMGTGARPPAAAAARLPAAGG